MSRIIDLSGMKFGRLTVVARSPAAGKCGFARWDCVCDCGSLVHAVTGVDLRNGHTKSCGCHSRDMARRLSVDETGNRYGRLVVLERDGADKRGRSKWRCACDCGGFASVMGFTLRGGKANSCGCLKVDVSRETHALDLRGRTFGWLTAIEPVHGTSTTRRTWACICQCGGKTEVSTSALVRGSTHSCGCARKSTNQRPPLAGDEQRMRGAIASSARRAMERQAGGRFTREDVERIYASQRGMCAGHGCGAPLGSTYHRDHIIPLALGGSNAADNIQLLCRACNLKKNAKDPIDWANEHGMLL